MRILICEDSEHNLQSAREFAEKVKSEHEVEICETAGMASYKVSRSAFDYVLTDLYLPTSKGILIPGGVVIALAALQRGIPVCIITDGHAHCDDKMVTLLADTIQQNNERLHLCLLKGEGSKGFKGWVNNDFVNGKLIKDWEFCFQRLTETKD